MIYSGFCYRKVVFDTVVISHIHGIAIYVIKKMKRLRETKWREIQRHKDDKDSQIREQLTAERNSQHIFDTWCSHS